MNKLIATRLLLLLCLFLVSCGTIARPAAVKSSAMMAALAPAVDEYEVDERDCASRAGEQPRSVCVTVARNEPPTVSNRELRVKRSDPDLSFELPKAYGNKGVLVIFKCRDISQDDKEIQVCRSPVALGTSTNPPEYVIRLNRRYGQKLRIAESLEGCDQCNEKTEPAARASCVESECRYPYMVVDLNNTRLAPLDPVVIIDP